MSRAQPGDWNSGACTGLPVATRAEFGAASRCRARRRAPLLPSKSLTTISPVSGKSRKWLLAPNACSQRRSNAPAAVAKAGDAGVAAVVRDGDAARGVDQRRVDDRAARQAERREQLGIAGVAQRHAKQVERAGRDAGALEAAAEDVVAVVHEPGVAAGDDRVPAVRLLAVRQRPVAVAPAVVARQRRRARSGSGRSCGRRRRTRTRPPAVDVAARSARSSLRESRPRRRRARAAPARARRRTSAMSRRGRSSSSRGCRRRGRAGCCRAARAAARGSR